MNTKVLAYVAAAAAVVALGTAGSPPALAAAPAPSCDLHLGKTVSNARPLLGHSVTFTLTASVKCNVGAVVSVLDALPSGLARDPAGEPLRFNFSVPAGQQVTRVFTVGAAVPAPDGCGARLTNTADAFAQLPNAEGALANSSASATVTSTCTAAPLLPATGERP